MAKVALVTGAAKRIGESICQHLHAAGYDIIVHYWHSQGAADQLVANLNQRRANSATAIGADLTQPAAVHQLAQQAIQWKGVIEVLVNNASRFYAAALPLTTEDDWDQLIGTNLKAPFLLCQQLAPHLAQQQGSIVNLVDIYAEKPLLGSPLYSIAKAGLVMLTRSLARELAPDIRVNGVAPGVILPPADLPERAQTLIESVPLKRSGSTDDIAASVCWLATSAPYITGQILSVDGGRSLAFAQS